MMITIFKNGEIGLLTQVEPTSGCWINVIDPTLEEISQLETLGFQHDFLTYPLDLDEQSHPEREDGEILIVLRIPYYQGGNVDVPYTTLPLGIILTDRLILTVCKHDNEILQGGIELNQEYIELARRRLDKAQAPLLATLLEIQS